MPLHRNAVALRIPLHGEPIVEAIGDDIDSCDLVYADAPEDCSLFSVADGDDDYITMVEDVTCPLNDPHCFNRGGSCLRCGKQSPWVRADGCGS